MTTLRLLASRAGSNRRARSAIVTLAIGAVAIAGCVPTPPTTTTTTTTTSSSTSTTTTTTSTTSTTSTTIAPSPAFTVDASFGAAGKLDLAPAAASSAYLPASDGGFFRLFPTTGAPVPERYTAAGLKVASFAPKNYLRPKAFVGQMANGNAILVGSVLDVFGTFASTTILDAAGGDTNYYLSTSGMNLAGDIAPNGRFAAVAELCSSSSCTVRVQQFSATGAALATWTTPVSSELGGYCSTPSAAATEFDDGSVVVSALRCAVGGQTTPIGIESMRFLPTGELDTTYGGGDGQAALVATDDGTTAAVLRQFVASDDGSMLVLSTSGTARRLAPDGTIDTTFGLVSVHDLLGGAPNGFTADGTGYVASTVSTVGPCGTGPATVIRIGADGATIGAATTLPWSLDGAALNRYPDGRILVSGATRTEQLNSDGTTSCVAPYTAHLARLIPT